MASIASLRRSFISQVARIVEHLAFIEITVPDRAGSMLAEIRAARGRLVEILREATVLKGAGGKRWPNCDFHSGAPELIERLDKLLLEAYGLAEDPLLEQMRTIRTGSAHELLPEAGHGDPLDS